MPIYEYRCQSCGKVTEILQKMSDAPLKQCPKCKGKVEKLISRSSFQLKGTGWYVTDYAGKKSSSDSESKTSESKSDSGSSEASAESSSKAKASGSESKPKKSSGKRGKE